MQLLRQAARREESSTPAASSGASAAGATFDRCRCPGLALRTDRRAAGTEQRGHSLGVDTASVSKRGVVGSRLDSRSLSWPLHLNPRRELSMTGTSNAQETGVPCAHHPKEGNSNMTKFIR